MCPGYFALGLVAFNCEFVWIVVFALHFQGLATFTGTIGINPTFAVAALRLSVPFIITNYLQFPRLLAFELQTLYIETMYNNNRNCYNCGLFKERCFTFSVCRFTALPLFPFIRWENLWRWRVSPLPLTTDSQPIADAKVQPLFWLSRKRFNYFTKSVINIW